MKLLIIFIILAILILYFIPITAAQYTKPPEPPLPKTVQEQVAQEFKDAPVMVEIARCESTYRQFDETGGVLRGEVNSADVGIFQINEGYHLAKSRELGMDIYKPEGNIAYARYLYERNGTSDWIHSKPCWRYVSTAGPM